MLRLTGPFVVFWFGGLPLLFIQPAVGVTSVLSSLLIGLSVPIAVAHDLCNMHSRPRENRHIRGLKLVLGAYLVQIVCILGTVVVVFRMF